MNTNNNVKADMDAQERLEQLGYKQELNRTLSPADNVVLSLGNASPVMAAFVFGMAPWLIVGTTSLISAVIQGVIVILIATVLAELGSIYPVSGGLYSIASYVLPKPLVYVTLLMFMLQAVIFPPSIALGTASYLQILFPGLPQGAFAGSMIAIVVTLLALLIGLNSIATSNTVTKILMAIQIAIIAIFVIAAVTHPQRGVVDALAKPVMLNVAKDGLRSPSVGAVFAGAGMMFAVVNGYDASLAFSEETKGSCRRVGRTVLISAVLVSVLVVTVFACAIVAAPDLFAMLTAPSALLYAVESSLGKTGMIIVNVGALVSSFSGLVVIIVYMARTLYTGGRDRVFPDVINRAVTKVSKKTQTPYVATVALTVIVVILVCAADLVALITFGSVLTATVYLLICVGSISHRVKYPDMVRPFRMKLFPVIPIVAVCGLAYALVCQSTQDKAIGVGLVVLALLYYYLYILPRDKKEAQKTINK